MLFQINVIADDYKFMKKHYLPILFFLAIMPIFFIGLDRDKSVLPSPLIGKKIPEFSLPSLINSELQIDSSEFLNNTFLFNVWATWCVGCLEEHDFLMKLSESNEIPIVGLNWRDNHNDALAWLRDYGNPYTIIAEDVSGRVAIDWGVYGAPESFLVNSNGIIIHKHLGPLDDDIWERDFRAIINDAN